MTSAIAPFAATAHGVLRQNSLSFTLAARLLEPDQRDRVAVLYAWCRQADDAIDLAPSAVQPARLQVLRRNLQAVYESEPGEPLLMALRDVVRGSNLPAEYPQALLDGLEMDVLNTTYACLDDLFEYCWCVAGVVGVMLCHVLGLSDASARRHAAHLGMAMQLTNVCRDVLEDWERGRLYLPERMLSAEGAPDLRRALGQPFPSEARVPVARVVRRLLALAEQLYRSADQGLVYLPFRAGLAARTARLVYAEIGSVLLAHDCDVFRGRAVVSRARKVFLLVESVVRSLASRLRGPSFRRMPLEGVLRFPHDVLR